MLIFLYLERGHLNKGFLELFLLLPKQANWSINFLRLTRLSVRCHQAQLTQVLYVHQVWMFQCLLRVTSQSGMRNFFKL